MSILSKILGSAAGPVVEYLKARQTIRSAERTRKMELADATHKRQVELISQGLAADANWEMAFANQASSSWKDEYSLIVVSIPAVLAFIPGGAVIVDRGFTALGKTPMWYQGLLLTLFFATVGIRYWRRNQSDT